MRKCEAKGFTLVELIVVLLIIGLLMAVVVPTTNYAITLGVAARAQTQVNKLAAAAEGYKIKKGYYPGQRDTAQLSTYTGSQILAACAFDYMDADWLPAQRYKYIETNPFVTDDTHADYPHCYPKSKYSTYEEDETLFTFDKGGAGERQHTLSDGFWITPMAICYYVSWPGLTGVDQFKEADNNEYTDDHIAADADFATFITSPSYAAYDLPYKDKMFLLISAGPDREFFSDDDATNWKK